MEKVEYPETVFCNRGDCQHCLDLDEPQSITVTREVGFVPLFDTQLEHRCDRKNIVVNKEGVCLSFVKRNPDIMRSATRVRRNQPTAETLGLKLPHHTTVKERVEEIFAKVLGEDVDPEEVSVYLERTYLAGRADEKMGVRVDG